MPALILLIGVDVTGLTCISMGAESVSPALWPLARGGASVCLVVSLCCTHESHVGAGEAPWQRLPVRLHQSGVSEVISFASGRGLFLCWLN